MEEISEAVLEEDEKLPYTTILNSEGEVATRL